MSPTSVHPKRRAASPNVQIPSLEGLSISKGETFHSPKSPPSASNDPVLDVASIPRRSLTSPEGLAEALAYADARISNVLNSINKSLDGVKEVDLNDKDAFPVPRFLIAHAASGYDRMDVDVDQKQQELIRKTLAANAHEHASDSGLGTSISGESDPSTDNLRQCRFCDSSEPGHADLHEVQEAAKHSVHQPVSSPQTPTLRNRGEHFLSDYATKKIQEHIVEPILNENRLKDYHSLVEDIPQRIGDRNITCLRDLEKTLIYLAPVSTNFREGEASLAYAFLSAKSKAKSAASYLNFAETSIQAVHTTVDHLNERDQRRTTDRPYTNNYFLDLVQQVRQYARIMAISRQKQREGKALAKEDWTPLVAPVTTSDSSTDLLIILYRGEKLRLKGGLSDDGTPAELVRERPNGERLAIDTGKRKIDDDDAFGDDAEASMARKRKCDQGKIDWQQCQQCLKWFKRPCDLTKHEKTHSRPWKCPEAGCKYHELGWPTEKERDRHINDRHTSTPAMYNCIFQGCSYSSKRESNCKQHMEKTHGYKYVRSKSRKGEHLTPMLQEDQQQAGTDIGATPSAVSPSEGSVYQPMSTPSLTYNPSPYSAPEHEFSPSPNDPTFMQGDSTFFPPATNVGPTGNDAFLGVGQGMPQVSMDTDDQDLYGYPTPSNIGTDVTDFSEEDIQRTLNFKDPTLMTNPEAPEFFMTDMHPSKDWFNNIDATLPREAWMEDFDTSAYTNPDFPQLMATGDDQSLFPDLMFQGGEPSHQ
ncbi:MAG: hypothetical protein Q9162_004458 [Coniocarpon cinnabarinum]